MKQIRILLADDHNVMRAGLKLLLERHPGFRVISEASEGNQAIENAIATKPDVAVLDIAMPKLSGIEAAQRLSRRGAPVVILLSTYDESTFDWTHSGAVDYIAKSSFSPERLLRSWQRTLR